MSESMETSQLDDQNVQKETEKTNGTSLDGLFEKLDKYKQDATKFLAMAITMQTIHKKDLATLVKLFEYYLKLNRIEMAADLFENELLKNFDLLKSVEFEHHFEQFSRQIIKNLSIKSINEPSGELNNTNEYKYFNVFLKLTSVGQEKLFKQLLDKHSSEFQFLKSFLDTVEKSKPPVQLSLDINEFYLKLANNREQLFLVRDLLLMNKKLIPDYGIFLIDGLMNAEKILFTSLIQKANTNGIQADILNIEKRSLNIIRRLCVIELIPEFVCLLEKLDNRHCYRWIEKSLEFHCKLLINSIQAKCSNDSSKPYPKCIHFEYQPLQLLSEAELAELKETLPDEKLNLMQEKLAYLSHYEYESVEHSSPFTNVYKLLDEIGKKLDWPRIAENITSIESKMRYLFHLKTRNDKQIVMSSLNKQISFYGLAFFFQKLIEFHSVCKDFFGNLLICCPSFRHDSTSGTQKKEIDFLFNEDDQFRSNKIDFVSYLLILCLKLWHKFNTHKEYLTIINKCLSNSKLDGLSSFKFFIDEYYTNYSILFNPAIVQSHNWTTVTSLNLKQKIPILANLFFNQKSPCQEFFKELNAILDQIKANKQIKNNTFPLFYNNFTLPNYNLNIFVLSEYNVLRYFSKVIIDKLLLLFEQRRSAFVSFFMDNDLFMGHLLVLIQTALQSSSNSVKSIYEIIFQLIKSKETFQYIHFFEFIYDVQILQDFLMIINSMGKSSSLQTIRKLVLSQEEKSGYSQSELSKRILKQLNCNFDKVNGLKEFYKDHSESLAQSIDNLIKLMS